ncbi:MAG TPA: VCBS repeat-containing protein [Oceanospirillales bacterium]|nr:VCBS repeat-containing protein [Oceanospirillales bacterium]
MKLLLFLLFAINPLFAQTFTEHQIDSSLAVDVAAGDLNGDGYNDIVAAYAAPDNDVKWFENNKDGTFTTRTVTNKAGLGPRSVAVVDVDGDNKLDVVLASDVDSSVYWYKNNGSGSFTEQTVSTNASTVNSVHATDMDNDGDIDILTSAFGGFGSTAKVIFFKNNGSESFSENIVSNGTSFVLDANAVELTGDNLKDVVVAETQTDTLRFFKQNANSTFTEQTPIMTNADGITGLFSIDLDKDGDMDVLSASQNDNSARWHKNTNSNFSNLLIASNSDTTGAYGIFAADFNFDGDVDVLVAAYTAGTISYHSNNGSQSFSSMRLNGNTTGAASVFGMDLDNNGSLDVISATENGVWWHENSISDIIFKNGFK